MNNLKKHISDNPLLIKEWDWEKNEHLHPNKITLESHEKVWWICSICNNSWEAEIKSRSNGSGCSVCSKLKRIQSRNTKHINNGLFATCNSSPAK